MVIQPTVEVNPVVNASATEANRWCADPGEQGFAGAAIGRGVGRIQTRNQAGTGSVLLIILAQKRNP